MPKKEFILSKEDLEYLLDACKPIPYIIVGHYVPTNPQENANRAWQKMGKKYGFIWDTARPCGKGDNVVLAEPTEAI